MHFHKRRRLNRRTFLRGLGGIAVALPVLDIMLDGHGEALASGEDLCQRFMIGFIGQSMGADNDPVDNLYVPDDVGANYDLKVATATLANHGNVADEINIVSGLRIPYNEGNGIPAGGWNNDFHTQALNPLLTGMRGQGDSYDVFGSTVDQRIAAAVGRETTFASLHYRAQASWYLTQGAPYGRDIISYQDQGGNIVPIPAESSPRAAFDSLFVNFVPPDPGDAAEAAYELQKRKSVLDLVRTDMQTLVPKLGSVDRVRMEQHLDHIRDLEMVLDQIPPVPDENCMMLPDPGDDPSVGGNNESTGGDGFDVNNGYSDEHLRAQVFSDLIHMAFVCDLSRVAALQYSMAQSHMSAFPIAEFSFDVHEVGHSFLGTQGVSEVIAWHIDLFGYLVAKLRDTPEGAGSLLDNCACILIQEGGHGFDPGANAENSSHSTENMACLTAGRAGGLKSGEHIPAPGMHPCHVLNSAMQAVGVDDNMGEVEGVIEDLFV